MKNRGRSKFFFCFRPVVVDDGAVNSDPKDFSGDTALPCTTVGGGGGKESAVIPKILKSLSDKNSKDSSDVDVAGGEARCRKSKSPRRFTRLIKAVLFDITLSKKFRNRKSRKKSIQSNTDGSSKGESNKFITNSLNEKTSSFTESSDTDDTLRINSSRSSSLFSSSTNASSSLSSSSCDYSISSNSRSSSERKGSFQLEPNQAPKKVCGFFCSTLVLCLFLLCLLVLILCGRICAILCTLACFFLCSVNAVNPPVNGVEWNVDVETEEYKKKVIMDGLLERDRRLL
ncbi:hypothetical protein LguiA_023189 [Lonicera macranthoides]